MAHTARAKNFPSKKLARKILLRNKHDRTTKTLGDACSNNVPEARFVELDIAKR